MDMTGCDTSLDLMFERAVERQWEEENMPPPADPIESVSTKKRIASFAWVNNASFLLGLVLEDIDNGIQPVRNTPQGDKLACMYDTLVDFRNDLKGIEAEIWRSKYE